MKALRSILLAMLIIPAGSLFAADSAPVELKWSPVRGAGGYRVEIRPESGSLIRRSTQASRVSILLKPGVHSFRVVVLNKFGRDAADTGWRPLRVRLAVKPSIVAVTRARTSRAGLARIRIRGRNLLKQTRVRLRGPDGIEHEFIPDTVDGGELVFRMRDGLPRGKYDVILKNPGEEPVVSSGALAYRGPSSGGGLTPDAPRADRVLARSLVLPGWGQFARGDYFKSVLVTGGLLLPLAVLDASRHQFLAAKDDVRATDTNTALLLLNTNIGVEASIVNSLVARTNQANLRQAAARYRAASALTLGFYAYNLWDAYYSSSGDEPVTRTGALWRSVAVPGWGQAKRGENIKGALLLSGAMISLALMSDKQANFSRAGRERDTATLVGLLIPISTETQAAALWNFNLFRDSETELNRSARSFQRLSLGLLALYAYNLYDAWNYHRSGRSDSSATTLSFGAAPTIDGSGAEAFLRIQVRF